jgi:hypothetical protein
MPENVVSLAALKSAAAPAAVAEAATPVATAIAESAEPQATDTEAAAALSVEVDVLPGAAEASAAAADATGMVAPLASPTAIDTTDALSAAAPATDHSTQPLDTATFEDMAELRELAVLAGEVPTAAAADGSASTVPTASAELADESPMTEEPTAAASPLSLGASLLARGMVNAPRPDPLAPLRRMTQAEKLAFFS